MGTPIGHPMTRANGSSECYGRTDGPTKTPITAESHLKAVDAGARSEDPIRLSEVFEQNRQAPRGRHEVIRTGDRTEIPMHVRSAVWYRDRGRCELCGWLPVEGAWHLDHIVPWSAGGPDTTDNLRVLCEKHNIDRSNFHEMHERTRRPATWWCINCYGEDVEWTYITDRNLPVCKLHGRPRDPISDWKACPVTRGYHLTHERTGEWPDWHQRTDVRTTHLIAFCAHCRAPGVTDVVL